MGNRYTLSAYKSGATLIKGIDSFDIAPNIQQILTGGSGATDPSFVAVGQAAPEIGFSTSAIKTALGLSGYSGVAMSDDTFYFFKRSEGGVRSATAGDHKKIVVAEGMLIPISVNAPQGQKATLGYKAHPTSSDGDTSPFVISAASAVGETGQDIASEIYTMGPASINGSELSGVSNISIDFGINLFKDICDGDIYPQVIGIISRNTVIRITTFDIDAFATWGLDGIAQGSTDSTVQLLDQAAGGVRGTSPITFTVDEGMIHTENITGNHGQLLGHSVVITPVSDGTAATIAITGI